jgi:acetoin utilization deacetylase AcuC-like enzyme
MIEMMWMPRLEAFKPEMIFISAGFDAHREDDMGQLGLTEQDYAWITQRIKDVAKRMPRAHRVLPGRRLRDGPAGAQRGSPCARAGRL